MALSDVKVIKVTSALAEPLAAKADSAAVNASLAALQGNLNEVEAESVSRDDALGTRIDGVEGELANKADAGAVNSGLLALQGNLNEVESESVARDDVLTAAVATKASAADLAALETEVDTKANAGDVNTGLNTLQTEINAIEGESLARDNALGGRIDAAEAEIATKANAGDVNTGLNTLQANLNAEVNAREAVDEVHGDQIADENAKNREAASRLGLFDRLFIKAGVYPLVERSGDILLSLDRIGRVVAPDFVRPGDLPPVMKGGVVRYIVDDSGSPISWFDARRQMLRGAGDMHDRPERVGAAPFQVISGRDALLTFGASGEIFEPAATTAPVVYSKAVDDGGGPVQQVFLVDGISERRLTASAVDCHAPKMIAPGVVRYGRSDGVIGLVRAPFGVTVGGNAIEGHFSYGQSLAIGSVSYAPGTPAIVRFPPSPNVLMFNGGVRAGIDGGGYNTANYGSLVPAAEGLSGTGQLSDTGLTGLGFALAREIGKDILVCSTGIGGTPYADLKKGTPAYNNFLYGVTRGKALADAASRSFELATLSWRHGANDEDKTSAVYLGYLQELQADLSSDVKNITGQASAPLIVMQQISRFGGAAGADELVTPSAAMFAARSLAGFILVGPQYIGDFGDRSHMLPASYCLMASYTAKAIRRHTRQGRPWKPLHVSSAVRTGKLIIATVAGGVVDYGGAITIDTNRVTDPGKYGVSFRDSNFGTGAAVTVASVEVLSRNTLAIYLSAVPTGTTPEIGFCNWRTGSEADQGRTVGPRCCIRDNDSEGCPVTGLPLHNYMIGHKVGVTTA